jgi:hypothetical protein
MTNDDNRKRREKFKNKHSSRWKEIGKKEGRT